MDLTWNSTDINDGSNFTMLERTDFGQVPDELQTFVTDAQTLSQSNLRVTGPRKIRLALRVYGTSADDLRTNLAVLFTERAKDSGTLTVQPTGASTARVFTLPKQPSFAVPITVRYESRKVAEVDIELYAEPYAYGSAALTLLGTNSVSPSEPTGDEWPTGWDRFGYTTNYATNPSMETDTNTDGQCDGFDGLSPYYTIAGAPTFTQVAGRTDQCQRFEYTGVAGDGGTNCVVGVTTAVGTFSEGDDVTASVYLKGSFSGFTNRLYVIFYTAAGVYISKESTTVTELTGDFVRWSVSGTAPANTSYVGVGLGSVGYIHENDTVDFYLDDIQIEKATSASAYFDGDTADCWWTGSADASTSKKLQSAEGEGWLSTASSGEFVVNDEAGAANNYIEQTTAMTVTASTRYGVGAYLEVTARAGGTFTCEVDWYTSEDAYVSSTTLKALSAVTGDTWYQQDVTSPATAAGAKVKCVWSGATGTCTATLHDVEFGKHLICAPNLLEAGTLVGDYPAPLDVTIEGTEADFHSVFVGRLDADSALTLADLLGEAEDWSWSGGTTSAGPTTNQSDGASKKNASTSYATASFGETRDFDVGAYLPLLRAAILDTAETGTFKLAKQTGWSGDTTDVDIEEKTITGTGYDTTRIIEFAKVRLPLAAAESATGLSSLIVGMKSSSATGGDEAVSDSLFLVPASWGLLGIHADDYDRDFTEVVFGSDGSVVLDDLEHYGYVVNPGPILAPPGALQLAVGGEIVAAQADAAFRVSITYTPRYAGV